MRPIDITDNRLTAESVLAVDREDIPKVVSNLTTSKRLSATIRNLNRLAESPADGELGRRALRHLGFSDA